MGRLYRPHVPLSVRVAVAERQLRAAGEIRGDIAVAGPRTFGNKLKTLLPWLARILGCEASELRLDHDPPLAARPKERRGLGKKTYYIPDANDPDHLFYRPHGPQHAGSHLIKTNVRGDHGQHPDRVLIKKQRRLENPGRAKKKARFSTLRKNPKRPKAARSSPNLPKPRWAKRPFPKRRKP